MKKTIFEDTAFEIVITTAKTKSGLNVNARFRENTKNIGFIENGRGTYLKDGFLFDNPFEGSPEEIFDKICETFETDIRSRYEKQEAFRDAMTKFLSDYLHENEVDGLTHKFILSVGRNTKKTFEKPTELLKLIFQ